MNQLPNKSSLSWAPPITTHHLPFGAWEKLVGSPKLKTHSHHHGTTSSMLDTHFFFIKRSDYWFPLYTHMAHTFSRFDVGCTTLLSVGFVSLTERAFQQRPFPPFVSWSGFLLVSASGFLNCPSPHPNSSSPSLPLLSPCLLSFLPPAQTSSQTQRVDGKYDWIRPWLQIMCEAAGKRGTTKNRERQREREHTRQWDVYLKGCS